jgi:hypothetical protein
VAAPQGALQIVPLEKLCYSTVLTMTSGADLLLLEFVRGKGAMILRYETRGCKHRPILSRTIPGGS